MNKAGRGILAINAGSSTIKAALFESVDPSHRTIDEAIELPKRGDAGRLFLKRLDRRVDWGGVEAVGHRVAFGMDHFKPERATPALLAKLRRWVVYDPDHLPLELELIEALRRRCPGLPQIVCYDTAFHQRMPRVAKMLPIPRALEARGVRRYGFHGLSYSYLMEELARVAGRAAARGRVILAHLGSGSSLAAVRNGANVDTSMGFSTASGVMMGTRAGDLDPGVLCYLLRRHRWAPERLIRMIHHESGLLGVSETSADMRELLARERRDGRAAEAVALYCHEVRKALGAFAAELGGLDTLVFSGGIGEKSAPIRERICEGLDYLGIRLDDRRNEAPEGLISKGRAAVWVIRTDEELMIARLAASALTGR
jgi:acetate kinase